VRVLRFSLKQTENRIPSPRGFAVSDSRGERLLTYSKNPTGGKTPTSFSGAIAFKANVDADDDRSAGTKAKAEAATLRNTAIVFIIVIGRLVSSGEDLAAVLESSTCGLVDGGGDGSAGKFNRYPTN
jgi:hypothetical protein